MGKTRRNPESLPIRTGKKAKMTKGTLRRRTVTRLAEVTGETDIIDLLELKLHPTLVV